MSDILLRISKSFSDRVVFKDLSLTIPEGKITCILGASGSGKTTLLKILAGLTDCEGEIIGRPKRVSYVFQEDRLIPYLTVWQNLKFALPESVPDEKIEEMLRYLGIFEKKDAYPTRLSGGQKQRVALTRAFLFPSDLLLLDEPFHSLDVKLKYQLIKTLTEWNERNEKTVVYVTHGVDEAVLTADKTVVFGDHGNGVLYEGGIDLLQSERKLTDRTIMEEQQKLLEILQNR